MPIYDYRCRDCGKVSEIFLRSLSHETVRCPDCGSENLDRFISASYLVKTETRAPGTTCCGRTERCQTPPCSTEGTCRRG